MSYQLGIDLGTTSLTAAVRRGDEQVETVRLNGDGAAVPAALHLARDGGVTVGDGALRLAGIDPGRVVRAVKRRLGDPSPIVVGGEAWTPEQLAARLVRWVVDRVAEREGAPAADVVLAHPAAWDAATLGRLRVALEGRDVRATFLPEPQAIALAHAADGGEVGRTAAVYDLGGGRCDVAVLRRTGSGFAVVGRPEGLADLGGLEIDELLIAYARSGDEAVDARTRRALVRAKETLSTRSEVVLRRRQADGRDEVRLDRAAFETLIAPAVARTVEVLRRAVASAQLGVGEPESVLLAGGSARIPLVGRVVAEALGRPVAVVADLAVARGAAHAAATAQPGPDALATVELVVPATPARSRRRATRAAGSPTISVPPAAVAAASRLAASRPAAPVAVVGKPVPALVVPAGPAAARSVAPAVSAVRTAPARGSRGPAAPAPVVRVPAVEPGAPVPAAPDTAAARASEPRAAAALTVVVPALAVPATPAPSAPAAGPATALTPSAPSPAAPARTAGAAADPAAPAGPAPAAPDVTAAPPDDVAADGPNRDAVPVEPALAEPPRPAAPERIPPTRASSRRAGASRPPAVLDGCYRGACRRSLPRLLVGAGAVVVAALVLLALFRPDGPLDPPTDPVARDGAPQQTGAPGVPGPTVPSPVPAVEGVRDGPSVPVPVPAVEGVRDASVPVAGRPTAPSRARTLPEPAPDRGLRDEAHSSVDTTPPAPPPAADPAPGRPGARPVAAAMRVPPTPDEPSA